MDKYSIEIFDGNTFIGYGATDAASHSRPITIAAGSHTIKAKFNGMTLEKNINLEQGETKILTFTFIRTEINNDDLFFTKPVSNNISKTYTIFGAVRGWWHASSTHDPLYVANITRISDDFYHTIILELNVSGTQSTSKYSFNVSGIAASSSNYPNITNIRLIVGVTVDNLIEIPSANDFDNWYVQNNSENALEVWSVLFQIPWGSTGDLVGGWNYQTGYNIHTISAKIKWDGVRMSPLQAPAIYKEIGVFELEDFENYFEVSDSVSYLMNGENLKLSSVPYDLLGTGVKDQAKEPPSAAFTYSPEKPLADKEIMFDASLSNDPDGTIIKYEWDFGDKTIAEGLWIIHTYSKGGEYNVTLKVTDNDGLTGFTKSTLIIKPVLEILDGVNFSAGREVSSDPQKLASGGTQVEGAVTDGVTRLLFRLSLNKYGSVTFSLQGTGNIAEDGILRSIGGFQQGNCITVNTVEVDGEQYAFAIYQSPENFVRGGYGDDDKRASEHTLPIKAEFSFCPPIEEKLKLVRPPLILVHGLWSSSEMWGDFSIMLQNKITGLQIFTVDYRNTNSSYFLDNKDVPYSCNGDNIEKTKEKFRSDKIAMIQADVLGHSMGGILSREWEGLLNPEYKREDNFEEGDIHKLITLDSPHFGSFLADFAIGFINALDPLTKSWLLNDVRKMGFPLDKGAIEDLQTTSVAIMYLNGVSTYSASHAIVGDFVVREDLNLTPYIGNFFQVLEGYGFNLGFLIPRIGSDLVVSVKSQQGGLASFASSTFNHHHTDAVGEEVVNEAFELLNISKWESLFESGFPINKWPEWQSK